MQATKTNKIWLSVVSVVTVIALILGVVALVNHGDTKANAIPTINQQVDNIKNTLPELEAVSTELKGYIDTLETTVEKLQTDLTATNTAIDTLETEVYGKVDAEKTATLNQLKADKTELEGKIAAANKAIEDAKAANTASEKAITDQIAALEAELEKADADNKKALEDSIAALQTALEKADADNKKALEDSIAALSKALTDGDTSLAAAIQTLDANLSALIKTNAEGLAALLTTAGDLQKQITDTNTKIDTIETELEGKIEASEKKVLDELNALKTSIEGQIATVNTDITSLKVKDIELETKIADLKTYVDGEIEGTEDWANATFATLAQYEAVQTTIAGIKTDIENINTKIKAIETDVATKVATINASIAGLDSKLAAKVTEVTDGYTNAVATAKTEITAAYTKAISDAITASETSMKAWVNETLANGYYDIAAIDAKLAALESNLGGADEELAKEIEDQKAALEQAKKDLTAAYENAITNAIETNNGVIRAEIAKAVQDVIDNVDTRLAVIDNAIAAIQQDIIGIKNSIATIREQIANLNASIEDLKGVDAELGDYINALEATAADLQKQLDETNTKIADAKSEMGAEIDALEQSLLNELNSVKSTLESELAAIRADIATLKAKDIELANKISVLESFVSSELQGTEDWANATFATLEQYEEVQDMLDELEKLVSTNNSGLEERLNAAINDAQNALQSQIDALTDRVAALEKKIAELEEKLAAQSKCLAGEHVYTYKDNGDGTHSASGCNNCSAAISGEPAAHTYTDGTCPTCGAAEPPKPTAQITDLAIIIDDVEYNKNSGTSAETPAVIKPESTVTLKAYGTNLHLATKDDCFAYKHGSMQPMSSNFEWVLNSDNTCATFSLSGDEFSSSVNVFEIGFSVDGSHITFSGGVWIIYQPEPQVVDGEITGVSLIVDGVEYKEGLVTVNAGNKIVLKMYGTNLSKNTLTDNDWVSFAYGNGNPANHTSWSYSTDGLSATSELSPSNFQTTTTQKNILYCNETYGDWVYTPLFVIYDASKDAVINNLSVTVDGVTYTSGNVTVYSDSTITLTVTGTFLQNADQDNAVKLPKGTLYVKSWDGETGDRTSASLSRTPSSFENVVNYELTYCNDWLGSETWVNTGIYMTYSSETKPN